MNRVAVLNVVGLTSGLLGERTPRMLAYAERTALGSVRPAFPAVTCSAQSNYLTGKKPSDHGIVGNGWYNREYSEIHFWKQSDRLVQAPKIWDILRDEDPDFTCAKLFWWYNMYSNVEYSITPRPIYPADGRKFFDVHSHPLELGSEVKAALGDFPFFAFWGPRSGIASSRWIARSARWVEEKRSPTLSLVYLPHLDYNLQRLGPSHPDIKKDLADIDKVVGDLIDFYESRSVTVALLSEYGITDVDQPIDINRILRRQGWLAIKPELGLEQLDAGASQAFAVADHQVAHVYLNDASIASAARSALEATPGIETVLDGASKRAIGIEHARAGDLIAIAEPGCWFTYYHWLDDALAPDFARCVDIHRKAGYDPAELFVDPKLRLPAAKVALFLAKKRLGLRGLLDVIPLDASLVQGSHGRPETSAKDQPVLIAPSEALKDDDAIESTTVFDILHNLLKEAS